MDVRNRIGFVVICFLLTATARAFALTPESVITEPPSPPALETIEKPRESYALSELIFYRVRITWPQTNEKARLGSPDLDLVNLELIGVSQEAASASVESGAQDKFEQILTFKFRAQKAGPASINRITIPWLFADGSFSGNLTVAPIEITIRKSWKMPVLVAAFTLTAVGGIVLLGMLARTRQKKRSDEAASPAVKSIEEDALEELSKARGAWEADRKGSDFSNRTTQIFKHYISLKLDWNPALGDYNALYEKAGLSWSKKEAERLKELFQNLEFQRFSGQQEQAAKMTALYESICSFVTQKKMA